MKNLLIAILVLLALTSVSFADQTCYVGEPCLFTTIVLNTSEYYYEGNDVTNSLRQNNGTYLYQNEQMTNLQDGNYIYNYTFNYSGSYIRKSLVLTYKEDETITVKDISENTLAGLILNNWTFILLLILILFLIGIWFLLTKKQ